MRVPGQCISILITRTYLLTEKGTSSQGSHWLLLAGANLGLGCSTDLLSSVLPLLLLPAHLGLGLDDALSHESVLGLELLGVVHGVVDQGEAGGLATAKVGLEPEHEDTVRRAVVHLGQ